MSAQENFASRDELTGLERLGLRVSAMINSPFAQYGRKVLIHQMDTDSDQDWGAMIELLAETEGMEVCHCEDRSVLLCRAVQAEIDQVQALASDLKSVRGGGGGVKNQADQ